MLKIDGKSLAAGALASLLAMAAWELFAKNLVTRMRDGSSGGEVGEQTNA